MTQSILLGTLTHPPSFRQTARGTPACTFDLQVDAGHQEKVCMIRVVIFGKQVEPAARQLRRGSEVLVAVPGLVAGVAALAPAQTGGTGQAVPWSAGTEPPKLILPPNAVDCHHHVYLPSWST